MRTALAVLLLITGCATAPRVPDPAPTAEPVEAVVSSSPAEELIESAPAGDQIEPEGYLTHPPPAAAAARVEPAQTCQFSEKALRLACRDLFPPTVCQAPPPCPACPACPSCPACPACPGPPSPEETVWWHELVKIFGGAVGGALALKLLPSKGEQA